MISHKGILLCCAATMATSALAQASAPSDAPPPQASAGVSVASAPGANDTSALGDIIVTAQRRSENAQKVPISITTLSAKTLSVAGVASTDALVTVTPGLTFTQQIRGSAPYIRGIGSPTAQPGLESPVAVYVDGVYYASPTGLIFQFNNIERVEVIKGPQGTLFGRNATGGLVSVVTRTPKADPSIEGSISYGNYKTVDGSLYATGGNDKIKADVALKYTKQNDGFGVNLNTGADVNRQNTWGARTKVLWTPSSVDTFTFGFDYVKDRSDLGVSRNVVDGSKLLGGVTFKGTIYDTQAGSNPDVNHDSYGANLRYERDLGDDVRLSSLTAFRSQNLYTFFDQDNTPARIVDVALTEKYRSLQQEIVLVGKTGRLDYTAGFFYLDISAKYDPSFIGSSVIPAQNYERQADQETQSYAGFAQGTYALTNSTKFTAGLRYTVDKRNFSGLQTATAGNSVPVGTLLIDAYGSRTYPKLTWRFALDQQISPSILAYASYNRGFKSGSFNSANINQAPVNPEVIDAYEAGVKSELFSHLLRINVAGFHYNYSGIQLSRLDGPTAILFNAAKGRINGAEAEIQLAPRLGSGELHLGSGLAYTDAKYVSFPNGPISVPLATGGNTSVPGDLAGNRMIRTPKFTVSGTADYAVPVGANELELSATYYHNSGFYWDPDNRLKQTPYGLLSAQAALHFGRLRNYTVRAFGKNLTNQRYFSYVTAGSLGDVAAAAPPRTYGVAFDFKF